MGEVDTDVTVVGRCLACNGPSEELCIGCLHFCRIIAETPPFDDVDLVGESSRLAAEEADLQAICGVANDVAVSAEDRKLPACKSPGDRKLRALAAEEGDLAAICGVANDVAVSAEDTKLPARKSADDKKVPPCEEKGRTCVPVLLPPVTPEGSRGTTAGHRPSFDEHDGQTSNADGELLRWLEEKPVGGSGMSAEPKPTRLVVCKPLLVVSPALKSGGWPMDSDSDSSRNGM